MNKEKNTEKFCELPQVYTLISADLSLKRPGFCKMRIANKDNAVDIEGIELMSIDNKKNTKSRGQLLVEIAKSFEDFIKDEQLPLCFVREKSINNCGGKMTHSSTAARTGISEVVGVMNYITWLTNAAQWDEIYPVTIKKLLTGDGKADKNKVADSLAAYLGELNYKNDDESDAAAVAVAWLINHNQIKQINQEDTTDE